VRKKRDQPILIQSGPVDETGYAAREGNCHAEGSQARDRACQPGGEIGSGQSGAPLNKPHRVRDRELGKRERVGAGGEVGNGQSGTPLHTPG
jgi:hypothetical protein